MKLWWAFCLSGMLFSCSSEFVPKEGDLFFQDIDCGPFCESIEKVTEGVDGADFSHVGIAFYEDGACFIIEAISEGVVITPIDGFLERNVDDEGRPKVLVGRVNDELEIDMEQTLGRAKSYLAWSYDEIFDLENESLYCSELVYFSYLDQEGNPIFDLHPMTFKDPASGEIFHLWQNYYDELGVEVPEGKAGLNPGGISRSDHIHIVHAYGRPDGYVKMN